MYDPHRNIFYYYRGPSKKTSSDDELFDPQIEDNTTKALINTFELCRDEVLIYFLKELNLKIEQKYISFDFQTLLKEGRPDGLIDIGKNKIYIESKINATLDKTQLLRHLKSMDRRDILVVITDKARDKAIIDKIRLKDKRIKFITWSKVYNVLLRVKTEKEPDMTILGEYLKYMELINLSTFKGFNLRDFECFVTCSENDKRNIKAKLKKFEEMLHSKMKKDKYLKHFLEHSKSELAKFPRYWMSFSEDKEFYKYDTHFYFHMNQDAIEIGCSLEVQKTLNNFFNKLDSINNKKELVRILKSSSLSNFHLKINKRILKLLALKYKKGKTRYNYMQGEDENINIASIQLGPYFTEDFLDFIIGLRLKFITEGKNEKTCKLKIGNKVKKGKKKFDITIAIERSIPRTTEIVQSEKIIHEVMDSMKAMKEFYLFNRIKPSKWK